MTLINAHSSFFSLSAHCFGFTACICDVVVSGCPLGLKKSKIYDLNCLKYAAQSLNFQISLNVTCIAYVFVVF